MDKTYIKKNIITTLSIGEERNFRKTYIKRLSI